MIIISKEKITEIIGYVKNAYPFECCGLLAGIDKGQKEVVEVYALKNLNTERTHDRYEIDPVEYMKADLEATKKEMQIIGIYHSHPDHPSRPSEFDASRAWEGYSYLIIAIKNGEDCEFKSWIFLESEKTFKEEEIKIE